MTLKRAKDTYYIGHISTIATFFQVQNEEMSQNSTLFFENKENRGMTKMLISFPKRA